MNKYVILLSIMYLAISCKSSHYQENRAIKPREFEYIDFTTMGGFPELKSIKIDSKGNSYMHNSDELFHVDYYRSFIIDTKDFDTISKLVHNILHVKFDTLYRINCDQCVRYSLFIKSEKSKFCTCYLGPLFENQKTRPLDSLAYYLMVYLKKNEVKFDSNYYFQSRKKFKIPLHSAN